MSEADDIFDEAWNAGGHAHSDEQILAGVFTTAEQAASHFTETAEPLGGLEIEPKPLDLRQCLPGRLAAYVRDVSDHLEVPPEAVTLMSIAALSAAAVGRHRVDAGGGWTQPLIVWTLCGLLPGERKSDLVRLVAAPLRLAEQGMISRHKADAETAEEDRETLEGAIKAIKKQIAKGGTDVEELEAELTDLQGRLALLPAPNAPFPRLLVEDITAEALSQRLLENNEALGVLTAEASLMKIVGGRYSGGTPAFEFFLKCYDEEFTPFDRIMRGTIILNHPALAMGLCVQPDVIMRVAGIEGVKEQGFLGRWIYALPKSKLGHRKNRRTTMPVSSVEWWGRAVQRILDVQPRTSPRPYLGLDPNADKLLQDLLNQLEPHLEEAIGRFSYMSDWAAKLAGKVLRIAGLFHLAEGYGTERPIDEATMEKAIAFGLWSIHHAERVYRAWRRNDEDPGTEPVIKWIKRKRPELFTGTDLKNSLRNADWYSPESRDRVLVRLHRTRWVASVVQYDKDGRRRGTAQFIPNPSLMEAAK